MVKGLVISCNEDFIIEKIYYNSFYSFFENKIGQPLSELCDSKEKHKVVNFTKEIALNGIAYYWELNVEVNNNLIALKFSGSRIDSNYLIIILEPNSDFPFLYEEMMRINNEQTNYVRKLVKEKFIEKEYLPPNNIDLDEFTKLNNELANLQRQLSKKNIELQKLNEIKNQFLGMAAHDLRNPIGHIYNYSELIEDESQNLSDRQIQFVSTIKNQCQYMITLINELLDYATIESGRLTLNLIPTDFVRFISNLKNINKEIADKKDIKIYFEAQVKSLKINLDQEKITQVVNNLITNAIKYTKPGGEVKIIVKQDGDYVLTSVEDNGLGIKEDEIDRLFNPFQITSNRATHGEKSIGLGLFIAKRAVEAHKGKIWVESVYGKGSKFNFRISKNIAVT